MQPKSRTPPIRAELPTPHNADADDADDAEDACGDENRDWHSPGKVLGPPDLGCRWR